MFPLASSCTPTLRPTQPSVQWVPRVLSLGVKRGQSVMLTTHPLLVSMLRKSKSYTSSPPNCHSWRLAGPLQLLLITTRNVSTANSVNVVCDKHAPGNGQRSFWWCDESTTVEKCHRTGARLHSTSTG
jgi:hypothetical protein